MAGHNKWSQIKHKKAKEDSKRGKIFTRLSKEITVAAREGGGDPAGNARLRALLEKARDANMPAENTQRAIKKGTGELPGAQYEELMYEGYGPHGVAIIVETLSDNRNRTVADLRRLFSKGGGSIAEGGAVRWMFAKKGVVRAAGEVSEEQLFDLLANTDIDDLHCEENLCCITCSPKEMSAVQKLLAGANLTIESAEIEWVPSSTAELDESDADKVLQLLSTLQDLDDVKSVYTSLG